jgi:hypothetical protein
MVSGLNQTGVLKALRARNPNTFFIPLLLSRHPIREWQSLQLSARFFSLTHLVVADTYYIYGMRHFLYWRMQGVLLLCGGHQKVIGDVPLAGWWWCAQ